MDSNGFGWVQWDVWVRGDIKPVKVGRNARVGRVLTCIMYGSVKTKQKVRRVGRGDQRGSWGQ